MPRPTQSSPQSGFTLIEMLISLALMVVLTGTILGGMANMQKSYRGNEIRSMLDQQIRAGMEMMAQEIGQAGLPPSGMTGSSTYTALNASGSVGTITPAVGVGSSVSVAVTNASVQQNQIVTVDSGPNAEQVMITVTSGSPIDHITAVFQKAHAANSYIYPSGVYPEGITLKVSPSVPGPSTTSNQSLIMFGDINGTGKLSIVQYSCPTTTSAGLPDSGGVQWGPLVRTEYNYDGTNWVNTNSTSLLDLVRVATTSYPDPANGCRFDYNVVTPSVVAWYMVTSVNVTLVAKSQRNDPQLNAPVMITKSFMNIQPRNILNANNFYNYNTANAGLANMYAEFNSTPSSVATQIGNLSQ